MEYKSELLTYGDRLNQLVGDYYEQIGKGCRSALADLLTGKTKRRVEEISQLTDIGDVYEVTKLFASVNLICVGSKDKEEASQKLYEAFMKGTEGGQRTGKSAVDQKIENIAKLAKIALDKNWEIRERRSSQRP